MTHCFASLRKWLLACVLLSVAHAANAASGCSAYSNYDGNSGKVWFNEYYFGPTTNNYLEVFSKNPNVTAVNSHIWDKWYIRVYSSKDTREYSLAQNTTACTVSGGRTYITRSAGQDLNYNDAMVVVFDGPPGDAGTKEIDAFVYSNASPPTPYSDKSKYYTPTCQPLKTTLDQQSAQSAGQVTYRGQNILVLGNFGNKDNARIPDGLGNWDETSLTGSGTSYTQCVTNDPVDLVKSFTWSGNPTPAYAGTVEPGAVVTFTVSARNATSASMSGVRVSDKLPPGLTLTGTPTASAGSSVSCSGAETTCVLTAPVWLPPNETASMTFQAIVSPSFAGKTIQNTAVQTGGTSLSPPPTADAFVTVAMPSPVTVAGFNACHNFSTSNCSQTGGRLYTRRAGVPFTTDIVALKADGTIETGYVGSGGAEKTLKVELINVANANAVVATQNATFPAGDTTGRAVVTWTGVNTAYRDLKVRISETVGTVLTTSLSNDSFAVRPSGLTITTSADATPNSPTSTPTSRPAIKAGTPFNVSATTNPASGYSGTASVDFTKLTTSNVQVGKLYTEGGTTPLSLTVNGAAASATYDEVGYFYAQPGAFRDDAFTGVDRNSPTGCDPASTCDCISAGDVANTVSDELVGSTGRYGCFIGNKNTVSFARFIPHHFAVKATPTFTAGHATCSFTYMDQPFTLAAEIEARNAGGNKTVNYHGAYAKGAVTVQLENADDGNPIPVARLNRTDANTWSNGSFAIAANRFSRPPVPPAPALMEPDGPYDALAIGVSVLDEIDLDQAARPMLIDRDMDNVTTACTKDTAGLSNGTCTAVNLLPAGAKTTSVRFGRLRLLNAHGSEILPLPVPMRLEYFVKGTGWTVNAMDSCTTITAGNVALQNYVPPGFSASMPSSNVSIPAKPSGETIFKGEGTIRLARPNPTPASRSSVGVCVDLGPDTPSATSGITAPACVATTPANMPWLQGRWSETKYDDDPVVRATFGVYKSGPIIYRREMY